MKLNMPTASKSTLKHCPKVSPSFEKSVMWNEGISVNTPASGSGTYMPVSSQIMPSIHVAKIPMRIEPFIFLM